MISINNLFYIVIKDPKLGETFLRKGISDLEIGDSLLIDNVPDKIVSISQAIRNDIVKITLNLNLEGSFKYDFEVTSDQLIKTNNGYIKAEDIKSRTLIYNEIEVFSVFHRSIPLLCYSIKTQSGKDLMINSGIHIKQEQ